MTASQLLLTTLLLCRDCVGQLSEWRFNEKSEPEVLGGLKKQDDLSDTQSPILSNDLVSHQYHWINTYSSSNNVHDCNCRTHVNL